MAINSMLRDLGFLRYLVKRRLTENHYFDTIVFWMGAHEYLAKEHKI